MVLSDRRKRHRMLFSDSRELADTRSECPDPARRLVGEGAQNHSAHAPAPEPVRDNRGVEHTLPRFDVGQERCLAGTVADVAEPGEEGTSKGAGVNGVARSDAG